MARLIDVPSYHSPGPWTVTGSGVSIDTFDGIRIRQENTGALKVRCANARLIAAAPELLDALEALLIVMEAGECEAMHPDLAEQMARAAVRKARGE